MEFQITKVGTLKYSRIKSISILRKEINSYGYSYTIMEVKDLLDSILNRKLEEYLDLKFKISLDRIIDGMEYISYNDQPQGRDFPEFWIPPTA